jgi:hypothetical protein
MGRATAHDPDWKVPDATSEYGHDRRLCEQVRRPSARWAVLRSAQTHQTRDRVPLAHRRDLAPCGQGMACTSAASPVHVEEPADLAAVAEAIASLATGAGEEEGELRLFGRVSVNSATDGPGASLVAPVRRAAFAFGPEGVGLFTAPGATVFSALLALGLQHDYVHHKVVVARGRAYLWVFRGRLVDGHTLIGSGAGRRHAADGPDALADAPMPPLAVPATWAGVRDLAHALYPDLAATPLDAHISAFSTNAPHLTVAELEAVAGFSFKSALTTHKERKLTPMQYATRAAAEGRDLPIWVSRFFLYCELRLLELFAGTGVTVDAGGSASVPEYLVTNFTADAAAAAMCVHEGGFALRVLDLTALTHIPPPDGAAGGAAAVG